QACWFESVPRLLAGTERARVERGAIAGLVCSAGAGTLHWVAWRSGVFFFFFFWRRYGLVRWGVDLIAVASPSGLTDTTSGDGRFLHAARWSCITTRAGWAPTSDGRYRCHSLSTCGISLSRARGLPIISITCCLIAMRFVAAWLSDSGPVRQTPLIC